MIGCKPIEEPDLTPIIIIAVVIIIGIIIVIILLIVVYKKVYVPISSSKKKKGMPSSNYQTINLIVVCLAEPTVVSITKRTDDVQTEVPSIVTIHSVTGKPLEKDSNQ